VLALSRDRRAWQLCTHLGHFSSNPSHLGAEVSFHPTLLLILNSADAKNPTLMFLSRREVAASRTVSKVKEKKRILL